jgi:preprotein translocase subunit SecG
MIVQIILAALITMAILLQKSSSIGLGAYSGSNESLFGAKGPTGFLAKATFVLALIFVINTLALGYLYNRENNSSVIGTIRQGKKYSRPSKSPGGSVPQTQAIPANPQENNQS